jgi:hypothetical protein
MGECGNKPASFDRFFGSVRLGRDFIHCSLTSINHTKGSEIYFTADRMTLPIMLEVAACQCFKMKNSI